MNKKKIIGTIALGGLMLGAPFAAFAFSGNSQMNDNGSNQVNLLDEDTLNERLNFMQAALELQIEHANQLIDSLDSEDYVDIDRLNEIVLEYSELEAALSQIDDEALAEDLREAFFESHMDERELSREFRDLIYNAFTIEEHEELRDEFRAEMDALKIEYDVPQRPDISERGEHRNQFDDLSSEDRRAISGEMGSSENKGQGRGQDRGQNGTQESGQGMRNLR